MFLPPNDTYYILAKKTRKSKENITNVHLLVNVINKSQERKEVYPFVSNNSRCLLLKIIV